MFPLILGDLIPDNDDNWENLLRLLKIQEIVFAPSCTTELAAYLGVLVEDYLKQFSQNYERRIIPKQHYMVHYPKQIVRYLRHMQSLFERCYLVQYIYNSNLDTFWNKLKFGDL